MLLSTHSQTVFVIANLFWMGSFIAVMAYLLALGAAMDPTGRWSAATAAALAFGDAIGPLVTGRVVDSGGYGWVLVMSMVLGLGTLVTLSAAAWVVDRAASRRASVTA